jgi:RNA-directed DNA polymerase
MKRIGNLYQKIISLNNLRLADIKAQKGKRKQFGVIKHNKNKERNILKLHESLVNKTYKTTEYSVFTIYEPKERQISRLSYYPNRILHHAIMNYLEPIFVKSFISQTYSCIKKRGIHKGLRDLNNTLKDKDSTKYCLKLDIKKFYPSIDKSILKSKLRTKFKDNDLLILLDEIIDSNKEGLPLGNYLSQWFSNFYLNNFDHWLKEEKKVKYFRYCDDIVILYSDKEFLHQLRKDIQEFLQTKLNLQLSNYQVFPVESRGIDFLGYKSFHDYIFIRKAIKERYRRMLRRNRNNKSVASYNGWLTHGNCINLQNKLLTDIY